MAQLQDKVQVEEFSKMKKVFEEQVGEKIEDCFDSFSTEPFASASLTQVYRARTKDGQDVALKIQKPLIQSQIGADMLMHWCIIYSLQLVFGLPVTQLMQEVQSTFKKELDFRIEATNVKNSKKSFQLLSTQM